MKTHVEYKSTTEVYGNMKANVLVMPQTS